MSSLSSWLMPATKKRLAYLYATMFQQKDFFILLWMLPSVHNLLVYETSVSPSNNLASNALCLPLYSRKLHILTLLANTSCVASFTILAFSLGGIVTNHFVRRTFPCLLTSNNQLIYTSQWVSCYIRVSLVCVCYRHDVFCVLWVK